MDNNSTTTLYCTNINCEYHNYATLYCQSCDTIYCNECDVIIHKRWDLIRHARKDIKIIYNNTSLYNIYLKKQLIYEIETYADNLDEVNQTIEQRINEIKIPLPLIQSNINTHFNKLKIALENREKQLLNEVNQLINNKVNILRRQQSLISIVIDKADKTIGFQDPRKQSAKIPPIITNTTGNNTATTISNNNHPSNCFY